MAVACPECGSEDIDLIEVLEDERRRVKCESCGHDWLRGEAKLRPVSAIRPQRKTNYAPAQIAAHPNGPIHYTKVMHWWSDEDDALSPIAPTLENPYCIQPYDPAFFNKGTRGHDRLCQVEVHPDGIDPDPAWMAKPHKPHWIAMCEFHARKWTGWEHRLRPRGEVTIFKDDDEGYENWIGAWPSGYVLNCERNPSSNYQMLHHADCVHISQRDDAMKSWTTQYIKVCSTDRTKLSDWAKEETGAEPILCQVCF